VRSPRGLAALALALALAAGCAKDRTSELETLRTDIEKQNAAFAEAFAKRDVAAIGSFYTADAEALPPGSAPVSGRAAIQDMWKGMLAMPVGRLQLRTVDVDGNGVTAWESGHYTILGQNGSTMDEGKYIVIWKRDKDAWRLYRDLWSSNSPQQAAPAGQPAASP